MLSRYWYCEVCRSQNHVDDAECQWCECVGPYCKRINCADPYHNLCVHCWLDEMGTLACTDPEKHFNACKCEREPSNYTPTHYLDEDADIAYRAALQDAGRGHLTPR